MIRWHHIYAHRWFYDRGDSVQSYFAFGGSAPHTIARAHANATYTLGRLLEAIR